MEDRPKFNSSLWFNNQYQASFEKFAKDHLGFKPFLIRVNNQFYYSVLSTSPNDQIIYGKDAYLYERMYLEAINEETYIGDSVIDSKIYKLEKIQDTLTKLNKNLIVMFAPTKARYFPEYIPDNYIPKNSVKTNYEEILKRISKTNIPYINFDNYLIKMKDTSKYDLMTKNGIHWTKYAYTLALDSILRFISKLNNINTPQIIIDSLIPSKTPLDYDNDIGNSINVFALEKGGNLAYPVIHIDSSKADKKKVRPLIIADSFWWVIYNLGLSNKLFDRSEFWYYFKEIYLKNSSKNYKFDDYVSNRDLKEEIKKFDLIILMQTEPNLDVFGFGFIEIVYDMFFVNGEGFNLRYQRIEDIKKSIRIDPKWLNEIKRKAIEQGITLNEAINQDAVYIYENENKKN
ncbi:MAG: hypothetical protein LBM25_04260 [Bacteroidales bacterium]|jgi:hypothetical protein|nr:hypothetical protein [Bacteroidales bacterium]